MYYYYTVIIDLRECNIYVKHEEEELIVAFIKTDYLHIPIEIYCIIEP